MTLQTKMVNGTEKIVKEEIFEKSSDHISQLAKKSGLHLSKMSIFDLQQWF